MAQITQNEPEIGRGHGLGTIRTMPEFRAFAAQQPLTEAQRRTLVDQAEILIDGLFVHLPLKRAMHAVDPSQRLRLLRHRLRQLSDVGFHAELLRIFLALRDLHTNYVLPSQYGGLAFLGVLIEQYFDGDEPHWIVSKVFDHLVGDPNLTVGAELTHWNGTPMATAVERNAEREAGSNQPARLARGMENMTLRSVRLSLPPDEDWVELSYTVSGQPFQTRVKWRVFDTVEEILGGDANAVLPAGVTTPGSQLVGLDLRTELIRQAKQVLFAPLVAKEHTRVTRAKSRVPRTTAAQAEAGVIPTTRPKELQARTVDTAHGTFGHLRIFTFRMEDGQIEAFLNEVIRLLAALPQNGLILDVRGNGGGYLIAAEFLLQFFCPRRVRPEPMQFINTASTADLCGKVDTFRRWLASIEESVETASQYSAAFPLYPEDVVNSVGQLYHGPVLLITDALCYSATDIFAAGFQDNGLGLVLGVDDNTGAGGANVLTHDELRARWTKGPLTALPSGAQFRVALRRSLRVGDRFGQPVEDLGVLPDVRHRLTKRDLLDKNADLMEKAGELLAGATVCDLTATVASQAGGTLTLTVTTKSLTSLDVYNGPRPVLTTKVTDGANEVSLRTPATGSTIRLEGFKGNDLVASLQLVIS